MEKIRYIETSAFSEMERKIESNIDCYLSGNVSELVDKERCHQLNNAELDIEKLKKIKPESGGSTEALNSFIVYDAVSGLSEHDASDPRVWGYLCHTYFSSFIQKRWLDTNALKEPQVKNSNSGEDRLQTDEEFKNYRIQEIKTRFFWGGERPMVRSNGAAPLWWWAKFTSYFDVMSHKDVLTLFCENTDFRASTVERPGSFNSLIVFHSFLKVAISLTPKQRKDRKRIREWIGSINKLGGTKELPSLPISVLEEEFKNLSNLAFDY